jgi:beta-lactamase class A
VRWEEVSVRLEAELAKLQGESSLCVKGLVNSESFGVRERKVFRSYSSIKTAIMAEVFRRHEAGVLSLDQRVPVANGPKADGSSVLKEMQPGVELTVRDLCMLMMIVSDNVATNLCIELAGGFEGVNGFMASVGMEQSTLRRKMLGRGVDFLSCENQITARDLVHLYDLIANGQAGSVDNCLDMITILRRVQHRQSLGMFLPAGTLQGAKGGGGPGLSIAAGLVWTPKGPFAICICAHGWRHPIEPQYRMARITRIAYDYFSGAAETADPRLPDAVLPEYLR